MLKTLFAFLALMLSAHVATATEINKWQEWVGGLGEVVQDKDNGIKFLIKNRDSICPQLRDDRTQLACEAAFDTVIMMRTAEKQLVVAMIATAKLSAEQRDRMITSMQPMQTRLNVEAMALTTRVIEVYSPKKTSELGQ